MRTRDIQREFEQARKSLDKFREEKSRAEGRLEQLMDELKTRFGFESAEEAEEAFTQLEKKRAAAEAEFSEAWKVFKEEWNEYL